VTLVLMSSTHWNLLLFRAIFILGIEESRLEPGHKINLCSDYHTAIRQKAFHNRHRTRRGTVVQRALVVFILSRNCYLITKLFSITFPEILGKVQTIHCFLFMCKFVVYHTVFIKKRGSIFFLILDFCKRRFFESHGLFRSPVLALQFSFGIIRKHSWLLASSDATEKLILAFNKSLVSSGLQQTLT
jgi:hypothetical protein